MRQAAVARLLLVMAICWVPLARAQGGPPMLTDDPGTPGDGHLETNIAAALEWAPAERRWSVPDADLNYGVGDDIQINLETSLAMLRSDGSSRWGAGTTSFAVKWRFAEEDRSGIAMSIYPRIERSLFASSTRRGLADPGTRVLLPIQGARQWGRVGLDAEFGSQLGSADRSRWIYGAVGGVTLDTATELMAELHGEAPSRFTEASVLANAGIRQHVSTGLDWIGSIGRSLRASPEEQTLTWIAYCGLQWLH